MVTLEKVSYATNGSGEFTKLSLCQFKSEADLFRYAQQPFH